MRYPKAIWKPWKYGPQPTYYRGMNNPEAVVLHIAAGYKSTIENWAKSGYVGASWHYTVCLDGEVWQHLEHTDGGYHAGITDAQAFKAPPVWRLWKGPGRNINCYTLGIEHEGFPGNPMPQAQKDASYELCKWLAKTLRIPLDIDHFPSHAAIDVVNRKNDFNTPALRNEFYAGLTTEGDPMTPEERKEFDDLRGDFNRLLRNVYGQSGNDLIASQIRAEERSVNREERMVAGNATCLAEEIQSHYEDKTAHGG